MGGSPNMPRWDPIPVSIICELLRAQAHRPGSWPEAMAFLSVARDYRDGTAVSIAGYAKLWRWSRTKTKNYLASIGAEIVYPESTKQRQNQRGQIQIRSETDGGQIKLIKNKGLPQSKSRSSADRGQTASTTKDRGDNGDTTPPAPPAEEGGVGGGSLDLNKIERYIKMCVRVPHDADKQRYLDGVRRRIKRDGGLLDDDLAKLAEAEKRKAQAAARAKEEAKKEQVEQARNEAREAENIELYKKYEALPKLERHRVERQAQGRGASPGGPLWRGTIAVVMRGLAGPVAAGEVLPTLKIVRGHKC